MTCPLWKGSLRWCYVCSGLTFKIMFLSHVPGLNVPAVKRVTKPFQGMQFCICYEWKGSRSCHALLFGMCPQWKGSLSCWRAYDFCIRHEWKGSRICSGYLLDLCPQWKESPFCWKPYDFACHEWKGSRSCLGFVFGVCPQWKGSFSYWKTYDFAYVTSDKDDEADRDRFLACLRNEKGHSAVGRHMILHMSRVKRVTKLFRIVFWRVSAI